VRAGAPSTGSVAAMARGRRSKAKGQLWRGYRRPVWRDSVFWFAILVGVCGTALQSPLSGFEGTTNDWVFALLQFSLTTLVALVLVGVLSATIRGFGEGWRVTGNASKNVARTSASTSDAEPKPAAKAAREPEPEREPEPTPVEADRPAIGIKMEHKARAFGRAFGAARRTYRKSD
jgi:hypothetical protein